jgi:glycosyltransferase involved in cell wall biosynthesis
MAALADHLSEAGHDVHLLFCPYDGPPDLWQLWYDLFDNRGVTLHYMPRVEGEKQHYLPQGNFQSKLTRFLQDQQFDIVHVADAAGYGQAFAILRAAGLASSRTRLVVTAHGGIAWHRRGNHLPWTGDEAEASFAEEQMLRLADIVCCPSAHMRDHLLEKGAISPERSVVLPNTLSHLARSYGETDRPARTVKEFVMIGRIERRKGITRFAEAIRMLQSAGRFEFDVTFLGTKGPGIELDDVRAMLGAKGEAARFIDGFGPLDVINYLRTRDCLVVVPSLRENLPYAVYECLENGIPLLASDVGGIPELVDERDRERLLIASDPRTLADAMAKALSEGETPGRLAFDPGEVALKHLALHAKLVDEAKRPARHANRSAPYQPSVACLVYGRRKVGEEAAARRRDALSDHLSIVDAETGPLHGSWASDANASIDQSSADWLLLCHALAVPEPGALTAMRDLLSVGCADAVVTGYKVALVDGEAAGPSEALLAPGGPAVFAPSWNVFGIGVVLMPRARFLELGGFRGDGIADRFAHWDLLNRLLAKEGKVFGIPKALVTGYVHDADELRSCLTSSLAEALLAPWLDRTPSDMHGFLRNSVGETFGDCPELKRAEDWLRRAAGQAHQAGFGAGLS